VSQIIRALMRHYYKAVVIFGLILQHFLKVKKDQHDKQML
jgi:hypothetical protein